MSLYLGIDGGGTKTTCVVGDDVSVLGIATGPGSNVVRLGEEQAGASLRETIARACTAANVSPLRVQAVCVGAAGATHPQVNDRLKQIVRHVLPNAEITVVGDMVIAMQAALNDHPGVVAIAGTGSIVYGRNERAETARAGGWGFRISDEGSGQWIGRLAVARVMRAHDEGRDTTLPQRLLAEWKLDSRDDLVRHANGTPAPNFADLFPVVQQAAQAGDAPAAEILASAGTELAQLATIVLRRLWPAGAPVRVGVAGGVFANSSHVRRAFYNSLHTAWPTTAVCFKVTDPVVGALWMARRIGMPMGVR
ncbi:MAG: N-acetylglucosamine kinase [Terriglobales bacterium]